MPLHTTPLLAFLTADGIQDLTGLFSDAESAKAAAISAVDTLLAGGQASGITAADSKGGVGGTTPQISADPLFSQVIASLAMGKSQEVDGSTFTATQVGKPEILQVGVTPGQPVGIDTTSPKQDLSLLLSQLQDIINTSETKGIVVEPQAQATITLDELANLTSGLEQAVSTTQSKQPFLAATQTAPVLQPATIVAGTASTAATGSTSGNNFNLPEITGEPGSTKTPTLRQESQHQALDGKIHLNDDQLRKDTSNSQSNQQDNPNGSQPALGLNSLSPAQGDQVSDQALFSLPTQNTGQSQQISPEGKVYTLPTGTMVAEQEVLNQVLQRFHLTNRDHNTRINLKLYPAELGELKIHLSIKEGSIKASVVAQSQHVQEILEKNMPKLKTVLEQQGFVVEDIIVSAQAENVANFDQFGGQLPNRQDFTFSKNIPSSATTFEAALDSSMIQSISPTQPGVNIRA